MYMGLDMVVTIVVVDTGLPFWSTDTMTCALMLMPVEVVGWNALAAPVGTPPDDVQYLNKAMNTVADMPEVKQKLNALGSDSYAGSSQELQKRFLDDIAKWANVIKSSGIQVQ
jgi:tripartite-type tricarboxylate transporter receptor subunit TctC